MPRERAEVEPEVRDPPDVIRAKVRELAALVRGAEHFVVFTGAGVSTSAGIPDFRGPEGKWTRQAQGREPKKLAKPIGSLLPTPAHMALVALQERGILKHLISQNCDGIHRRSGFPASALSELHGNRNVEICEDCGERYFRDYSASRQYTLLPLGFDHWTGRTCHCSGRLLNSTIDFGQNLEAEPLEQGFAHAERADLHLVLGSSLTVSPACDMPKQTRDNGGKLVIVNLQPTPLSKKALHIFADTDTVMEQLLRELALPTLCAVPPFRLLRRVVVGRLGDQAVVRPVDPHDASLEMDFLTRVEWAPGDDGAGLVLAKPALALRGQLAPTLHFVGHYGEPPCALPAVDPEAAADFLLAFDPAAKTWEVARRQALPSAAPPPHPPRSAAYGKSHREYCLQGYVRKGYAKDLTEAATKFDASRRRDQENRAASARTGHPSGTRVDHGGKPLVDVPFQCICGYTAGSAAALSKHLERFPEDRAHARSQIN